MNIAALVDELKYCFGRGKRENMRLRSWDIFPIQTTMYSCRYLGLKLPAATASTKSLCLINFWFTVQDCFLHWFEPRLLFRHLSSLPSQGRGVVWPRRVVAAYKNRNVPRLTEIEDKYCQIGNGDVNYPCLLGVDTQAGCGFSVSSTARVE